MKNFSKSNNSLTWEFSNLELPNGGHLSLASMILDFSLPPDSSSTVTLNLIEQNMFNQDGTIAVINAGKAPKYIRQYLRTPAQWKLDSMYPRFVTFTLNNVNIDTVKFASFTLMIT